MKKLIIFGTFLVLSFGTSTYAQNIEIEKRNRINAQKIAFFTQHLQLSPEEAERFWPVFNEFQQKRNELHIARAENNKNYILYKETLSDKEVEKISDQFVEFSRKESDLLVEYHKKFKEILPIGKVMKLYEAEIQFKNFLLRQIRDRQEQIKNNRRF